MLFVLVACKPAADVPLDVAFADAAAAWDVPVEVLAATAWTQSRFSRRESPNREGGVGLFDLREDGGHPGLADAAEAAGLDADDVAADPVAEVHAAAALLRGQARDARTLEDWVEPVAEWSGADDPVVAGAFADLVLDRVAVGLAAEVEEGRFLVVDPQPTPWRAARVRRAGVDRFVPDCHAQAAEVAPDHVIVRLTGGTWAAAVDDAAGCARDNGAHYVVRGADGDVTQMLAESDAAWTDGEPDAGALVVEVEGYAGDAAMTSDAARRRAAAIVRDLMRRHAIDDVRLDVGGDTAAKAEGFDWEAFLALVADPSSAALVDGELVGRFVADVVSARYGEADSCSGDIEGGTLGGDFYLRGTCTLVDHADAVRDVPVLWIGRVDGASVTGTMVVDDVATPYAATIGEDGSLTAEYAGAEDAGVDVGTLEYAVALEAAGEGAAGAAWLGLDANAPLNGTAIAPQVADPAIVADAGAGWVRINFLLGGFSSIDDPAWAEAYRTILAGYRDRGVQVYGLVGREIMSGDDVRFQDETCGADGVAWVDAYTARFVKVVDLFKDDVRTWESFNEPNDWSGTSSSIMEPCLYAYMLQQVWLETKQFNGHDADPAWRDLTIVSGPLFAHWNEDGATAQYLADTYAAGTSRWAWDWVAATYGQYPLDGVGLHLYEAQGGGDAAGVAWEMSDKLRRFQAVTDAWDPGKPVWISEIGWQASAVGGDDAHAEIVSAALDALRGDTRIAMVNWFSVVDFGDTTWGLRTADLQPKVSYTRFQQEAAE
ncbi:MAG: N-acetylmuramoyl-L-alanine amidase [Myxococcota bacterium]